ncbi:uncharacterized protein LOC131608844 [Vicia villosa]|uniref:uncharacterized protein LOC131608844 n=1 Tax=Vicia villosa TaxID=3911 RepID=UPI00273C9A83|nr:uncharacterized protein LOC131608844 [Vicia villosa]
MVLEKGTRNKNDVQISFSGVAIGLSETRWFRMQVNYEFLSLLPLYFSYSYRVVDQRWPRVFDCEFGGVGFDMIDVFWSVVSVNLTQFNSASLNRHVSRANASNLGSCKNEGFVEVFVAIRFLRIQIDFGLTFIATALLSVSLKIQLYALLHQFSYHGGYCYFIKSLFKKFD